MSRRRLLPLLAAATLAAACSGGAASPTPGSGDRTPTAPPGPASTAATTRPSTTRPSTTGAATTGAATSALAPTTAAPPDTTGPSSTSASTLPPAGPAGLTAWSLGAPGTPSPAWTVPGTPRQSLTGLAAGPGTVVARWSTCAPSAPAGGLLAVDAASGAVRWRTPSLGPPAAGDDAASTQGGTTVVVVAPANGRPWTLAAVDVATGAVQWRTVLGTAPARAWDLSGDPVVVALQGDPGTPLTLVGVGRADGRERFRSQPVGGRRVEAVVAGPGGIAVTASLPATAPAVVGIDPGTGANRWELPGWALPDAASATGGVVPASGAGVAGVDLVSGAVRWRRPELVAPARPPGARDPAGIVLAGDPATGRVVALRPADGSTAWVGDVGDGPAGAGPQRVVLAAGASVGPTPGATVRVRATDGRDLGTAGPARATVAGWPVPLLATDTGLVVQGIGCPGP